MEYALIVWAIGTLPPIGVFLCTIGTALCVLCMFGWLITANDSFNEKFPKKLFFIPIFMLCVGGVIPDKETAYAMAAAYGVQSVLESEKVQSLANESLGVLESFLKKKKEEIEKGSGR